MSMAEKKRVLVIGGSGYLGQHLLDELAKADGEVPFLLAFTHHRPVPPPELINAISPVLHFRVDHRTYESFKSISDRFGKPDVVVNCAALSDPRACEEDPASAMSTNVPYFLVNWLSSFGDKNILLIHLSTDQVYEGTKSFYKEEDEAVPVSKYGISKAVAEMCISENWSNYAILRSSIIYGPQTISPVSKPLPVQWMDSGLSRREEIKFFDDEYRCPIFVKDVVNVILELTKKWISDGNQIKLVLNVGGPDRLSSAQMARAIAKYRGYDRSLVKPISASSVTINRGVKSPADISMDISNLIALLGKSPISFKDGVKLTLENVV